MKVRSTQLRFVETNTQNGEPFLVVHDSPHVPRTGELVSLAHGAAIYIVKYWVIGVESMYFRPMTTSDEGILVISIYVKKAEESNND